VVVLRVLSGVLICLVTTGPLAAQETDDSVQLYTNADLLQFGPPADPAQATAVSHDEHRAWEFVGDFLAREQARIAGNRSHDLERRRVDIEEETVDRRYARRGLAYPYAYGHHFRNDRRPVRRAGRPTLGGPIVPLHARPSQAQVQRARAIRRSGTDAFPR
jgi:hypothetical protein